MIKIFKEKVESITENRVQVKNEFHKERVIDIRNDEETCNIPSQGDSTNEKQYLWINRLEGFRDAMLEVHKVSPKVEADLPRVKVGSLACLCYYLTCPNHVNSSGCPYRRWPRLR